MKKQSLVIIITVFSLFSNAQTVDLSSSGENKNKVNAVQVEAEILGMKETSFDFGRIPQGKPVTHVFEVTNTGNDSLKIENVQASCGCTTPEWEREKVQAAGEKTKINVGFNAASEGPFTKTITITYNGSKSKQITIKGDVWKTPVTSAPENKELGNLKDE